MNCWRQTWSLKGRLMTRRGNRPDYSLDPEDWICWNCKAPADCATSTCPRDWLGRLEKLERQAGGLVACASTVYLAALTGQDAQTVRQRARRGEYGPTRQRGRFWCVPLGEALEREANDARHDGN
jgi:hypothetical protein